MIYAAHQEAAGAEVHAGLRLPSSCQLLMDINGYLQRWKKLNRYKYYRYLKGALGLIILG